MDIGIAERPCQGETVCGDTHLVISGEVTLVAMADGLGHGPAAREAAVAFKEYVEEHAQESLEDILRGASAAISKTRGVAAALARIDQRAMTLSFAGVGNIEMHTVSRERIRPVSIPGIVGSRLRKVKQFDYNLALGDLLMLHSDGISSRLNLEDFRKLGVQEMADTIMEQHGKWHDDVTCLVIRI